MIDAMWLSSSFKPRLQTRLRTTLPLVHRVIAQTKARVFRGDTHVPDNVVSLFEPHTTPMRKGKLVKPTEFGHCYRA